MDRSDERALKIVDEVPELQDSRILFVGFCWGAAGSAWLARLLNCHESILSLHAPEFSRFDHFKYNDSLEVIESMFRRRSFGAAYPVVGFTHGIPIQWREKLEGEFKRQFRCFI